MRSLRVAFVVQGEGRGHMTQALALSAFLRDAGHEVSRVLVGCSPYRSVPEYFRTGMGAAVEDFDAPTQVPDTGREGVSALRTMVDAVRRGPRFAAAVRRIAHATADSDVVVNLLDLLGGVSRGLFPSDVPALAIAHNYLFFHPDLAGAPGPAHVRRIVLGYARATATGTERRLALAFRPGDGKSEHGLEVTPPLLRPGLDTLGVGDDGFLLAYALNAGYGNRLAGWQRRNPEVTVHCFVDGGANALAEPPAERFHVHELDQTSFLEHLARCRAYVGSAGFESICEAHYLGKPVLAVPTRGQFEQVLNAWDAERCGAARPGTYDDLDDFWADPGGPSAQTVSDFRSWVAQAPSVFVDAVERTAHDGRSRSHSGDTK